MAINDTITPSPETPVSGDATQFGDDVAAEMRAYFETHKRDKWQRGTADNLMLGLFNIAARAVASLEREERLDYERRILAAEVEWVQLARQSLAFCEMMERNTSTLDCALIQANATAEARKWDRYVVEGWMPALLELKSAITQNALFPDHGEQQPMTAPTPSADVSSLIERDRR
jgi:hypothetical protein